MDRKYAGSFHLKPACRDCACLLININEASPWTGNMLVVFILKPAL